MKVIQFLASIALVTALSVPAAAMAADLGLCKFDTDALRFDGTVLEQTECLLRKVKQMGSGSTVQDIPQFLVDHVGEADVPSRKALRAFLAAQSIAEDDLGGVINDDPLTAIYFVIHDTSSPELSEAAGFPPNIDDPAWSGNKIAPPSHANLVERVGLIINRAGLSRTMVPWNEHRPKTATKIESSIPASARNLFIHVENTQPRIQTSGTGFAWKAPEPGFSDAQLNRLALAYVAASVRAERWLIPAFHFNIDFPIPNAHDDPQNFALAHWVVFVEEVTAAMTGALVTARLLDANDMALDCPATGDCPLACAAHIEVTNSATQAIDLFELTYDVSNPTNPDPDGLEIELSFGDMSIQPGETRTIAGEVGRSRCEGVDFDREPTVTCTFTDGTACQVSLLPAAQPINATLASTPIETHHLASTIYYLALEEDYAPGSDAAFRDLSGNTIAQVSSEFLHAAEIEGSAKLNDGRVVNYVDTVGGVIRWELVDAPFGLGVDGCRLVPFRSVAVDRDVVPMMSRLFIKETVGLELPGGDVHDGIWYAMDVGGGINGERVDLFGGAGKVAMDIIYGHGIDHLQELTVDVLNLNEGCPIEP